MLTRSKPVALAAGLTAMFAAAVLAQGPGRNPAPRPAASADSVTVNGHFEIIKSSYVSALREGVVESLERHVGDKVTAGTTIGALHKKSAELNAAKAKVAADSVGEVKKAEAQYEQAAATLARAIRLDTKGPGNISQEEMGKAKADATYAYALIQVAKDSRKINQQDQEIADQIVREHDVIAPINGIITEILKHPGESVRSNEPVARVVGLDRLRWTGFVPVGAALRLKVGDVVYVRPMIEGADLPVERMSLPATVTFISPEANPVARSGNELTVYAELDNPTGDTGEYLLRQAMKADMTITFGAPADAVGAR